MAGGKARPRHDRGVKVGQGEAVKTGKILSRAENNYKAGANVGGMATLFALCCGKVYFTHRKTSHGRMKTFINVEPAKVNPK